MEYIKKAYKSEYNALVNAIHRCHNPSHQAFYNYGARGIAVCDEWRNIEADGFELFLSHIGPKPLNDVPLSLDRIDNERGYEPNNVRWANRQTQQRNRRRDERVLELEHRAQVAGLAYNTVRRRIERGVAEGDWFSPAYKPRPDTLSNTLFQISLETGLSMSCLIYRYKKIGLRGEELAKPTAPRKPPRITPVDELEAIATRLNLPFNTIYYRWRKGRKLDAPLRKAPKKRA